MRKTKGMLNKWLLSLTMAFAFAGVPGAAQAAPVEVYGQTLHPDRVEFRMSDYTWSDLSHLVPEILPKTDSQRLSAGEVCKLFHDLNELYLIEIEEQNNDLIYQMEFVVNRGLVDPPADLALTDRLASRSPEALEELLEWLPEHRTEIMRAKKLTERSLAMILLHDAALANCPDYAAENDYLPIATYKAAN